MSIRAHKRLWTLCIANEPESRKAMKFIIGAIKHFATQAEAEIARNAYHRQGTRCYILSPVSAWAGKKAHA